MKKIGLIIICLFIVLTQNAQTELWGMTTFGGQDSIGNIFKIDVSGNTNTNEYSFSGTSNGGYPWGSLMQASDDLLYGLTSFGGANFNGVLFQYDPSSHTYNKKIDLNRVLDGAYPDGSLMQASDGMLYGVTSLGGVNDLGTLFQYDPVANIFTKKLDFAGTSNGAYSFGSLIQATNGLLYGLAENGGINGDGVLFQYDLLTGVTTKKIDFNALINGSHPEGSLIEASNGKLYGMTMQGGGVGSVGGLFEYDPLTNICNNLFGFDGSAKGAQPLGSLVQALDENLYGLTVQGGLNNMGVLFQYNPITNIYTKKIDFDGLIKGSSPRGTLMQASDGNLYGLTNDGGVFGYGVLFQFNPITDMFTKKLDFNHLNGANPAFTNLIEINTSITKIKDNANPDNLILYPNPNNGSFTFDLISKSKITITNVLGETVFSQWMEIGKQTFNLQYQINGVYFVKVTNSYGLSTTKKVVVN
jgi:uncharacterized repeat protein (TIGR03803 family)